MCECGALFVWVGPVISYKLVITIYNRCQGGWFLFVVSRACCVVIVRVGSVVAHTGSTVIVRVGSVVAHTIR